jgi:hypothetical protein
MTARNALEAAKDAEPGERLRRYETICSPDHAGENRSNVIPVVGSGLSDSLRRLRTGG